MSDSPERPLVTFAVIAYRQEAFIREAVAAAFAQTYSPLEIILTDDCSPDRTFAIMEEMAAEYEGPHTLVLNRNPTNYGIGQHVNRIVDLATGSLIIVAAGDDISLPERTERLVSKWNESDGKAAGLLGAYREMNEIGQLGEVRSNYPPDGTRLRDRVQTWNSNVGCAEAFTKQIWERFGPLNRDVVSEDAIIFFRSWAIHPVLHLSEPLVHYRIHSGAVSSQTGVNLTNEQILRNHRRLLSARAATFKQYLIDLDCDLLASQNSDSELTEARRIVSDELRSTYYAIAFHDAKGSGRWKVLAALIQTGAPIRRILSWVARSLVPGLDLTKLKRHGGRG